MIRHVNFLVEAQKGLATPAEIAVIATRVAENFPNSPISEIAETVAAKNLREVLRADAKVGHTATVASAIGISMC